MIYHKVEFNKVSNQSVLYDNNDAKQLDRITGTLKE